MGKSRWGLLGLSTERVSWALVLKTWVGCVVGLAGHPQSPPHGSVTRQGTTGFEGMPGACCIYTRNLLACGEEGGEGEEGMEHIWLPDILFFLSWLRALAVLGAGGERQGNGSGAREGS